MIDQAEMTFWKTITDDRRAGLAEFQAYLEQYPNGAFAALARLRVSRASPFVPQRPGLAREIAEATARLADVPMLWMLSARRERRLARARQVAMVLIRDMTDLSLPQIGRVLGNRDHTTVMHAIKTIQRFQESPHKTPDALATLELLAQVRAAVTPSAIPAVQDSASVMAAQ